VSGIEWLLNVVAVAAVLCLLVGIWAVAGWGFLLLATGLGLAAWAGLLARYGRSAAVK
jgi:hypothetical protein